MANTETSKNLTAHEQQLVRLSVNMNPETAAALKSFASKKHLSYTEAVRRAIAIAAYIEEEVEEGRKIQTVDPTRNEVRELVLV
jgi:hypothetical protein